MAKESSTDYGGREVEVHFKSFEDGVIAPVPVGPLPVRHHLPHHHAVAPHVGCCSEAPVTDGFGRRPSYGNFSSLQRREELKVGSESKKSNQSQ